MTRSDQFATVMDAVRAAFNDFSERRISCVSGLAACARQSVRLKGYASATARG
jgi:hypothetical protein